MSIINSIQNPASTPDAVDGHTRLLAQALMKRCIADIPLVTHLQKESAGMNKLYSQSMCSVKQWKSYQAAEALISAEVEEVRMEADEIEPGWSQVCNIGFYFVHVLLFVFLLIFSSCCFFSFFQSLFGNKLCSIMPC